ncbi:JDVT-CTERM system glutamic-type intramembrane protease [Salinisphaera sp.]|uniref:JDVT-CTERM system glutamic-type intramembrane protease MrtJ n=1 Tax=Salinisphaera sp. TaxID=1914330 RepID=UPI000C5191AF|nr:JDVT-CTERM system glutamic-type intramembrane protease [Salinisphaera sp.]MBS61966.1 CPBP family intramembrane metalloprotease [Salinisphaera sp.]
MPALWLITLATPAQFVLRWPGFPVLIMAVGVLPLLEEIVFRLGVHDWLRGHIRARWGPLSAANLFTAALFAVAHLLAHPPAWALATFFPALVFGALWERHARLWSPVSVHAFYNLVYFCCLGAG